MGKREVQTRKRENKGQEQSSPVAGILASHPSAGQSSKIVVLI